MNVLLQRAKKSRVGQWSLAYLAGAWFLLQLIDVVGARWGLSSGAERAVDVLVVGGFFVTVIVAWYHGERGRQRVSGSEILLLAGVLAVTGLALPWVLGSGPPTEEPTALSRARPAIAVLPLRSIGEGEPFFAEGLHEELVYQLSKLRGVDAISRTSTLQYTERPPSMRDVASELGATAIAEGSVRLAGDRVRITIQLIDGQTDTELLSQEFNRDLTTENLFDIQVEIAQAIALALRSESAPDEIALGVGRPTESYRAYEHYLQGRAFWTRRSVDSERARAIRALESAVDVDPAFGLAWVALADALMHDFATYGNAASGPAAVDAVEEARVVAAGTLEAEHLDARWAYLVEADYSRSRALLDDLLDRAPGLAGLLRDLALLEARRGRFEDGLEFIERELSTDPASIYGTLLHALFLTSLGRYEDADVAWERAAGMDPGSVGTYSRWVINRLGMSGPDSAEELLATFPEGVRTVVDQYPPWGYPPPSPAYFEGDYTSLVESMPPDAGNVRNRGVAAWLAGDQAVAGAAADTLRARWRQVLADLTQGRGPSLPPLESLARSQLAVAAALVGDTAEARAEARASADLSPTSMDAPRTSRWHYVAAQALTMVGDHEGALELLAAYASVPWGIPPSLLRIDPLFAPLRGYPEFLPSSSGSN